MPGRIEGAADALAAVAYVPVWKLKLYSLLKRGKK